MEDIALLARVLLFAVLLTSGTAKLLDRSGTRSAVDAFGVPARLVGPVALALPLVEVLTAALLLPRATSRVGAAAALLLLLGISAAVGWNLANGRHPECQCFGRLGSSDVSGRTLARNALLVLAAGVGLTGPSASLLTYAADRSALAAAAVAAAGVGAGAAIVAGEAFWARRVQGRRAAGADAAFTSGMAVDPGERGSAPAFVLPDLEGRSVALTDLLVAEGPLVLLFLSPSCGPCRAFAPTLAKWSGIYGDRVRFAVLTTGAVDDNRAIFGDMDAVPVLLDDDRHAREAYGVVATPSAVLVTPAGELASPVAVGDRLVRRVLAAALAGAATDLDVDPAELGAPADSLDLDSSPGPRSTVTRHDLDTAAVLVDEASGASVALDPLGSLVWDCLDGSSRLGDVVEDLADAFDVAADVVARDVLELVRELGRNGMIDGIAAEWPDDEVVEEETADLVEQPADLVEQPADLVEQPAGSSPPPAAVRA